MKLWQKNFNINKQIELFTIGQDNNNDLLLASYDIIGTLAHIIMLESIHLINNKELLILIKTLKNIYTKIVNNNFKIDTGVEDIHSQIEITLTNELGEIGKKIHSGRSRNDQILLDIKLFIRKQIEEIVFIVQDLFNLLIKKSEKYKTILMPGYTHYQVAMPSSFGLWFAAYAESLIDDLLFLYSSYQIVNKNPLGSAAGYGSSFPLNRKMTTELLGFDDLNYNVIYAQMTRSKTERIVAQAISSIAFTLNKMSQDICLYINNNYNFISFPDELTTGSSIMPHKKNPDVFELIRANCNKIIALPNEIAIMSTNFSIGYHRDFQLIKDSFLPIFNILKKCLNITIYMLENIIINKNLIQDHKYKYAFSVEAVHQLVKQGIPFRDAYQKISLNIKNDKFHPNININHTHEGSIGNLSNTKLVDNMNKVILLFPFKKVNFAMNNLLKRFY